MSEELRKKATTFLKLLSKKKIITIAIIVLVIYFLFSPFLLRAAISFGNWHEVHERKFNGDIYASSAETKFYSNGVWMETYSDGSGSDGEWEILSDYTFIYDNGYDVTYYKPGDWFWIGTNLYLGDEYQFTRLPFLYPEDED